MELYESLSSDAGPLWFAALAVIAILASAWSATTIDEGLVVPLAWVIPPFALALVSLGVSMLALSRTNADENTGRRSSVSQNQLKAEDRQTDPESASDSPFESSPPTSDSDGTGKTDAPQEVDVTDFADSKR